MKVIPNFEYGQYCLILWALSATVEFNIDENRSIGNSANSTNLRLRFGFGQAQSKLNKQYRAYDLKNNKIIATSRNPSPGVTYPDKLILGLPTLNTGLFNQMPTAVKSFIANVAEMGHRQIHNFYGKSAFADKQRNNLFAKHLNHAIGFPNLNAYFEYYDIMITSCDVHINRHMDVSTKMCIFVK